ncbi:S53 family peptidase [Actinoplanes sp. TBRC 11911]|uniref:S53 family peptidase n=1 Tax=Actinoplanes sp. TBRC 11911 TaxID=2729386 RepID=UPI00289AB85E|nr:S53 family peptidase [Actinoplanes sp. TBRC 11911]
MHRRVAIGAIAGAAALVVTAAAAPASAAPTPSPGRHAIANSAPKWLSQAKSLGATPSNDRITFGLLLNMRNSDDAVATLQRVSDPDSRDYGKWLSDGEFRSRFGPKASDVAEVQNWLKANGFRVEKTLPSGMYVEASGTTAQIDKVFGTTVNEYSYQSKTVHANAGALSFPGGTTDSVVASVAGVLGIDQGAQLHRPADVEPGPATGFRPGQPCSAYFGQNAAKDQPAFQGKTQSYDVCGYGPQQLQTAYGESSLLRSGVDGRGVTVAITDAYASPTMAADAQQYNRVHHQPAFRPGQYREVKPAANGYDQLDQCDPQGWYGEESLDVEAVHAMAPGANIVYVGATDCNAGLDTAWAETIDYHRADVVSNSWGNDNDDINVIGADTVKFYSQFSLEAALTGITVNFSSGDAGDQTAGGTDLAGKTVDFPADLPYVTGVGGTSIGIGKNGERQFEYGWQGAYSALDGKGGWADPVYASGGGGGTSFIFPQPFYQKGKVAAADSKYFGGQAMRTVPDIAMVGDPNTGFQVGQTQVFPEGTHWDQYRIGGTSLSSPLLAGVIAVASQNAHHKLGFVNPFYYKLLSSSALDDIKAPAKPVTQVRTDFINTFDASGGLQFRLETIDTQASTIHSRKGYDTETGTGTPNGAPFFKALKH